MAIRGIRRAKDARHPIQLLEAGIPIGWATEAAARRMLAERPDAPVGDGALSAWDDRSQSWLR